MNKALTAKLAMVRRPAWPAGLVRNARLGVATARRHGVGMTDAQTLAPWFVARRFGAGTAIAAVLAMALSVAGVSAALAQRPAAPADTRDDLRPLSANSMDIAEGKQLAQRFCADCHGPNGISTIAAVPNLAGQRAAYLYREMHAYLMGARGDDTMNGAITYLSTGALSNVAAYYATLDPAQPPAAATAAGDVDSIQAGKTAAAGCAACHGEIGITKMPGIPSLVGQEPKYLVAATAAYKSGERKNDTMKAMAAPLTDANVDNISLFYALQKPARAQTPAPGEPAAGQALAAPCAACHGANGVSGNPSSPSLAGQDAQYLAAALRSYKDGTRSNSTMKALVVGLDDNAIRNLSAFYAGLQPQAPDIRKPLSAPQWAERCDRCHGVNGNSTDPRIPALAAQREGYLEKVLDAYRTGARRSPEMAAMSEMLSESDVRNIAAYYARQKAQAVVYVPMPAR
jgi:cytochrome c553